MFFRQLVDDDLGCASYLVGDEGAGEAVVVDPAYAIEPYVETARRHDLRLVAVLETHTHADHVSGHGRLALEHDLPVHVHPAGEPAFASVALEPGGEVRVGDVRISVLHTPGHRPEHCCFVVTDLARAEEPWFVLTGDSLFVGDAARPDLAVGAAEGARHLFASLGTLLELPDGVEVYPGHVSGSLCGAGMSSKASSTIGYERRWNRATVLRDRGLQAFVTERAATGAARPPNLERVVTLNRGPFLGAPAALERVETGEGATVLDVRAGHDYAAGHRRGALSVPLTTSGFATRAGSILSLEERIVLQAATESEAERAAASLRAVGFVELDGYLLGGEGPERLAPVELEELEELVSGGRVDVLDVREAAERDGGYIPGSRNLPLRLVRQGAADLPHDRQVVTICASGLRAGTAASILVAQGIDARPVLDGGIAAWQERGNRTVAFRRCGG